jgi:hypothetical protein
VLRFSFVCGKPVERAAVPVEHADALIAFVALFHDRRDRRSSLRLSVREAAAVPETDARG